MINSLNDIIQKSYEYDKVYIYGAGKWAEKFYSVMMYKGVEISGFITSSAEGNPTSLFRLPVISIETFKDDANYVVFTAVSSVNRAHKQILDIVMKYKLNKIYFIKDSIFSTEINQCICDINQEKLMRRDYCEFTKNTVYSVDKKKTTERNFLMLTQSANNNEYRWRMYEDGEELAAAESIDELLSNKTILEEFEEQYGIYNLIPEKVTDNGKSCKVYMARCHVDKKAERLDTPEWVEQIQVGAALTDLRICSLGDNTGENISERNGNYSECTAIYWMWKNAPKTDYIGLCHYRRHFDINNNDITLITASKLDVLATSPTFFYKSVRDKFLRYISETDFNVTLEAVKNVQPEYYECTEKLFKSRFLPPCNMFIMKQEVFEKYCEFVFSVAFEIERIYDSAGVHRNDRYMGFIFEWLFGIFIMKNKNELKVAYTDMKFYR